MGFAFVGVGGDSEDGGAGGGDVEDEGDGLGFGVAAGQGDGPGLVNFWTGPLGVGSAVPGAVVEFFEQGVGAVDLVAGGGEVLADGADVGAAGDAVLQEAGGFGLVGVGAGAGVDTQLGLERVTDGAGLDEADQALGEDRGLGAGGQPDGQPRAVRWSTALPWASAAAMPSSMSRSYRGRSGRGPSSGSR